MPSSSSKPVALVTGAGRRLGYHLGLALMERGYELIATYRTETEELVSLRESGAQTHHLELDSEASLLTFAEAVTGRLQRLDVLINNASTFEPEQGSAQERLARFANLLRSNTLAPYFLIEALAPLLREGTNPCVLNITDIFAQKPNPRFTAYCATKAALQNLTLSYAQSLAPTVRVNALMPGPIRFLPSHTKEQREAVLAQTPLAREGGFEPAVQMALSLIENDFVTGACVPVDGGRLMA